MAIIIKEGIDSIDKEAVLILYDSVGWTKYTSNPDILMNSISNSSYVVTCYEDGALVGLARCISDDCSICYVQDILVHPEYQGRGLGRKLLEKCMNRYQHVRTHVILTDDEKRQKKFYESLGYKNTRTLKRVPLNCYVKIKDIDLQ